MTTILPSMSHQAISSIIQLFKYYLYSVFDIFCSCPDLNQQNQLFGITFAPLQLRNLIESIRKSVILDGESLVESDGGSSTHRFEPPFSPHFSPKSTQSNQKKLIFFVLNIQ